MPTVHMSFIGAYSNVTADAIRVPKTISDN